MISISWKVDKLGNKTILFIYRYYFDSYSFTKQVYPVDPYDLIYAICHKQVDVLLQQTPRPDTEYLVGLLKSYHLRKSDIYRLLSQKKPHPIKLSLKNSNWGGYRCRNSDIML